MSTLPDASPTALPAPRPAPALETTATLEQLLLAVGRGDEGAFDRLYELQSGALFGVVRRVLRNPAHSEEVLQEVFVEAWRTAARFDPARGSARTWLVTIARARAVDRVRAVSASVARDELVGRRHLGRSFDHVVEEVQDRLDAAAIRECLGSLTALQREAVDLAYYDGLTYREVAHRLDVPLGTVKTRLRDGLLRLRGCMSEPA